MFHFSLLCFPRDIYFFNGGKLLSPFWKGWASVRLLHGMLGNTKQLLSLLNCLSRGRTERSGYIFLTAIRPLFSWNPSKNRLHGRHTQSIFPLFIYLYREEIGIGSHLFDVASVLKEWPFRQLSSWNTSKTRTRAPHTHTPFPIFSFLRRG